MGDRRRSTKSYWKSSFQQAVVFAEQDDRYRDLAAGVEEAWKAQVGAAGWHRTDLEGTVNFVGNGERLVVIE